MKRNFAATAPLLRATFAAVALVVTLGIGSFIDGLAIGYVEAGQQAQAAKAPLQLARR
jgi:hypothetical protein